MNRTDHLKEMRTLKIIYLLTITIIKALAAKFKWIVLITDPKVFLQKERKINSQTLCKALQINSRV